MVSWRASASRVCNPCCDREVLEGHKADLLRGPAEARPLDFIKVFGRELASISSMSRNLHCMLTDEDEGATTTCL